MADMGNISNQETPNSEADEWRLDVTSEDRRHFVGALERAALARGGSPEEAARRAAQTERAVLAAARSRAEYLARLAGEIIRLRNVDHVAAG